MMAATHRLGGAALGLLAAELLISSNYPLLQAVTVTGAILGSLIPDIDNPRSSISRKWKPISYLISMFQTLARALAALLPRKKEQYVRSIVGHRGISHSLTMCIIISGLLYTLCISFLTAAPIKYFCIGIPVGMVSHILLDILSGGAPLFSPFSIKRITLANIKTGGAGEWIFRSIAILLFIAVLTNEFWRIK